MILTSLLFSMKHIQSILFTIIYIWLFLYVFLKPNVKNKTVIMIFVVLFYIIEVVKTIFLLNNGSYNAHDLPFYPCDLPLYFFWTLLVFKNEKVIGVIKPVAYTVLMTGGVTVMLYPSVVIGSYPTWAIVEANVIPFFSMFLHASLVLVGLYMVFSGYYQPKLKDLKAILVATFIILFALFGIDNLLETNFSFYYNSYGNPLAPLFESNIFVFRVMTFLGLYALETIYFFIGYTISILRNKRSVSTDA